MKEVAVPRYFCNLALNAPLSDHFMCAMHVLLLLNILEGVFAFLASSLYDSPNFYLPLLMLALETGLGIGSLVLVFGMSGCIGTSTGHRFEVLLPAALLEFLVGLYEAYLSMRARMKRRTSMAVKLISGVFAFVIAFIPSLLFALSRGVRSVQGDGHEQCRNYPFNVAAEAVMLITAYSGLLVVVWAGMKRMRYPRAVGVTTVVVSLTVITATAVFVFLVNDKIIPVSYTTMSRNWLTMQVPAAIMPVLTTLANKVMVFQGLRPKHDGPCYEEHRYVEHRHDTDENAIPWDNSEKTLIVEDDFFFDSVRSVRVSYTDAN